jgi:hypothetical protein
MARQEVPMPPSVSIGTSQCDFDDRRTPASSSAENQSASSGVAGSSGSSAPGMSAQRNVWKVRTSSRTIGCIEYTAIPNWPGKAPKPNASSGPPIAPSLLRSMPDGMPVFEGATKRYG